MYRNEGAEELKKHVRHALEKEGMEIDFQAKGDIKVKRRKVSDAGDEGKSLETMAA